MCIVYFPPPSLTALPICQCLAAFKPLAQHVAANEEGTLIYEALIGDANPLDVVIFER